MNTIQQEVSFGFTQQQFPAGGHICYLYTSEEERRDFMSRFIESGLSGGERVAYLADSPQNGDAEAFFASLGVPLPPARPGQVVLAEAEKTYCPEGFFAPEYILETWRSLYTETLREGFRGIRATGETTWLRPEVPGLDRWFEYEAKLNLAVRQSPYTGIICQYDARHLDGAALYEVLNVHPLIIVRGRIVHNPFYEPPEQYLARGGSSLIPSHRKS